MNKPLGLVAINAKEKFYQSQANAWCASTAYLKYALFEKKKYIFVWILPTSSLLSIMEQFQQLRMHVRQCLEQSLDRGIASNATPSRLVASHSVLEYFNVAR